YSKTCRVFRPELVQEFTPPGMQSRRTPAGPSIASLRSGATKNRPPPVAQLRPESCVPVLCGTGKSVSQDVTGHNPLSDKSTPAGLLPAPVRVQSPSSVAVASWKGREWRARILGLTNWSPVANPALLYGPYRPPPVRRGDRSFSHLRGCYVVIT